MSNNAEAAALLNRSSQRITDALAERLISNQPALSKEHNNDVSRLRFYARQDISRLFSALAAERPELFSRYIRWQRSMLESQAVPLAVIKNNLLTFRSVLLEIMPEKTHALLLTYLGEAMDNLDEALQSEKSFLDPDNPFLESLKRYLQLLLAAQKEAAVELVNRKISEGVAAKDIYLHILQPAQYEIGRLWQINNISAAEEKVATDITLNAMNRLRERGKTRNLSPAEGNQKAKTLLSACIGNELHEIDIRIINDYFYLSGWKTIYVGANTPPQNMPNLVDRYRPDILALSVTMHGYLRMTRKLIQAIRKTSEHQPPILVGGIAFNDDESLWQFVEADACGADASEALQKAEALLESGKKQS